MIELSSTNARSFQTLEIISTIVVGSSFRHMEGERERERETEKKERKNSCNPTDRSSEKKTRVYESNFLNPEFFFFFLIASLVALAIALANKLTWRVHRSPGLPIIQY